MTPPRLSSDITAWAQRAGYHSTDDADALVLYSEGGENRYYVRERQDGWWELSFASRGEDERFMLRASSREVLEHHLVEVFGVTIRDEAALPFLRLPYKSSDLATGYHLDEMSDGFRTLSRDGEGPVAMARDKTLSMLVLVPLSHYLQLTIVELEQAFLNEEGSPLLSEGQYRTH
ncbi:Imm61 family immunity protein [Mycobacterium sp. Root265]|uniref:Imm61 family immunity protein n=1 Tax=Mycobacterium sp. Root265 TaxID=1736504 RepID=UPI00070EFF6E|nr:Imm61 family immunity protein [Mycobacterium sp. Root265]